jgi:probable F420-dependent oxidoreductase
VVTALPAPAFELGVTLQCDLDGPTTARLAGEAEVAGFSHLWLFDSQLQWRDPYPLLTLAAVATERIRLGTCVTNPWTRHPTVTAGTLATLAELSGGRIDLGIGRGDSAVRMLGEAPPSVDDLARAVLVIRDLVEGRSIGTAGGPGRLGYSTRHPLPVWIAGYGPRVLALAGRVADGVIIQLADPDLVAWFAAQARDAARQAGRDPAALRVMVSAPAVFAEPAEARDALRWFPALVANHVLDLLRRAAPGTLPPALVDYVDQRARYDYVPQHTGDYSFVDDATVARFCILGSESEHAERIAALRRAGMTQLNIYPLAGREAETIARYGKLRTAGKVGRT